MRERVYLRDTTVLTVYKHAQVDRTFALTQSIEHNLNRYN